MGSCLTAALPSVIKLLCLTAMRKIVLPETKPAFEWVNGRALQKVSPKRQHALAQGQFHFALSAWSTARGAGMVGPEWRFHIQPPGEERRPLVPDVAFLSYRRLPYEDQLKTEEPRVAPDIVVEVKSPDDRREDIEEKVRVYLVAGTLVVFLVDPNLRNVTACEQGRRTTFDNDDMLTHEALPGFSLPVRDLFTQPLPK